MKIEIESSDYNSMVNQIRGLEKDKAQLQEELKNLSQTELKKDAATIAVILANRYLELTFEKLGFKVDSFRDTLRVSDNFEHWLGKNWGSSVFG